ncbi:hypothetical protein DPSP01_000159 [Paraphaeosphaeria sporulosa]|uniref:Uncharacterized protein n=1 Tax=Paraphaeosphaeria sporulosa TaxID=1460663 RepID=A0A177D1A4_9PLEO|nr:uncharacterized protein CC84DRAFT_1212396 [Paraphaeosphaeria sporulosa]OAG12910.1 hypothetical protein CC84DRAFT_1212396 [Paraphaeosphaeria sporulosa]
MAALETCEKDRQDSPVGSTNMSMPRIQGVTFYNKDWDHYHLLQYHEQQANAVGVRLTADWEDHKYPSGSLNMDSVTCRERIYATATCGFSSRESKPIASGVSLFDHQGHVLLVEVESRELFENERRSTPKFIQPLQPQESMLSIDTGNYGDKDAVIVIVTEAPSSIAEPSHAPVDSNNAGLAEPSGPTSTATPSVLQAA